MKSEIAREVLWLIVAILLSFPLALGFLWILDLTGEDPGMTEPEKDFLVELYLIGYVLSFLGIYLMRLVAILISTSIPQEE